MTGYLEPRGQTSHFWNSHPKELEISHMKARSVYFPLIPIVLLLATSLAAPAPAQSVKRFDMGDRGTPVEPGFTAIRPATTYSKSLGYGWVSPLGRPYNRPAPPPNIKTPLPAALIQDGHSGTADGVFQVDLPAGTYLCQAYLGDLGSLRAKTPREKLDVLANGSPVVTDAYARTAGWKAKFDYQAYGGVKRVRFLASPQLGALKITFHCDATSL